MRRSDQPRESWIRALEAELSPDELRSVDRRLRRRFPGRNALDLPGRSAGHAAISVLGRRRVADVGRRALLISLRTRRDPALEKLVASLLAASGFSTVLVLVAASVALLFFAAVLGLVGAAVLFGAILHRLSVSAALILGPLLALDAAALLGTALTMRWLWARDRSERATLRALRALGPGVDALEAISPDGDLVARPSP
jgi:hypothetical protein